MSVTLFVSGAYHQSDVIREVALLLLLGGLVLLGSVGNRCRSSPPQVSLHCPRIWLTGGVGTNNSLTFHNGYLVENFSFLNPGSYLDFVVYWWLNLGLIGPLVILAAVLGRRADRKLLVAIMTIFAFGNVVMLGVDVVDQITCVEPLNSATRFPRGQGTFDLRSRRKVRVRARGAIGSQRRE